MIWISDKEEGFGTKALELKPSWMALFKVADAGDDCHHENALKVKLSKEEKTLWPQLEARRDNEASCFAACMLLKRLAKVGFWLLDPDLGKLCFRVSLSRLWRHLTLCLRHTEVMFRTAHSTAGEVVLDETLVFHKWGAPGVLWSTGWPPGVVSSTGRPPGVVSSTDWSPSGTSRR